MSVMLRLNNRQQQIPNGLRYYLPQTKWASRPNASFNGIVEGLYRHLQGNPSVLKTLGWKLDFNFLADKVDEYNAKICEKMGWGGYIMEVGEEAVGGQPKRPFPSVQQPQIRNDVPIRKKSCCGRR
jgi:hypothetical protein